MKNLQNQPYKANLTGEPFLFFEIRQLAELLHDGVSTDDASQRIIDDNLFQYETHKSIPKRLRSVLDRLSYLDEDLISLLATGDSDTAKIINLYTIFLSNRLFREFMIEVINEKFTMGQNLLEESDMIRFFRVKKEQDDTVSSWQDYTFEKLRQVFFRIIMEAGILTEDNTIYPLLPYPELKLHMQSPEAKLYLNCIEGNNI